MKRLEVSGAVRHIYGSLGVKRLTVQATGLECIQEDHLQAVGRVEQGRGRRCEQVYPAQVLNLVAEQ